MSITQTVEIPVNHRLVMDVPREIPAGLADVTLTTKEKSSNREWRIPLVSWLLHRREERQIKALMRAYGCLANNPAFQGDPVEIVRKWRDEWDRPWDVDVEE